MHNQLKVICDYLSDIEIWTYRIFAMDNIWNQSFDFVLRRTSDTQIETRTHCRKIVWKCSSVFENVIQSVHWIRFIYNCVQRIADSGGRWFHIWKCHKQANHSEIYRAVSWIKFNPFNSFISWLVAHKSSEKAIEGEGDKEMNAEESVNCNSIYRNEWIESKGHLLVSRWKSHPFGITVINDCYSFI